MTAQGGASGDDPANRMRLDDAGELVVQSAVEIRQLLVIEAHEMKDGRVQIAQVTTIHCGRLAEFVRLPVARPGLHARARHPVSEALGIMIASAGLAAGVERFGNGHATELAASKRGATDEVKRLSKRYDTLPKEITTEVRERVLNNPPPDADRTLVDLYCRMLDLSYTNRTERTALFREIASRRGQISHDGTDLSRAALALTAPYGGVAQHGMLVEISWMSLADPTRGAPALLDWPCAKGCRQFKYDFEGGNLFGNFEGGDEGEE